MVYSNNSGSQTAAVGSRPGGISWVGAYDMSGNVWEWTSTIYEDYPYNADDGRESNSNSNSTRVLRGGSWLSDNSGYFRASNRLRLNPNYWFNYAGFRCARSQ